MSKTPESFPNHYPTGTKKAGAFSTVSPHSYKDWFTPEHAHFKVLYAKAMSRNVSGYALTRTKYFN